MLRTHKKQTARPSSPKPESNPLHRSYANGFTITAGRGIQPAVNQL